MKITAINAKTITIDAEPGERIAVDPDGYAIDTVTLRFAGNSKLHDDIVATQREIKALRADDSRPCEDQSLVDACYAREYLLTQAIETLPRYRVKRVFVGGNY
jgi:hypothetical protein